MATNTTDDVFLALKVIGSVRENERLCTQNRLLSVDNGGRWQSILRWYYKESRSSNLDMVTTILSNAFSILDHALQREDMYKQNPVLAKHFLAQRDQNCRLLGRGLKELRDVSKGLHNLLVTYKTDSTTVAKITLLLEKINDRILLIAKSLEKPAAECGVETGEVVDENI